MPWREEGCLLSEEVPENRRVSLGMVEEHLVFYLHTGKVLLPEGFRSLNLHKVLRQIRKYRHLEWERTPSPLLLLSTRLYTEKS